MGRFAALFIASLSVSGVLALPAPDIALRTVTAPVAEIIVDDTSLFKFESIQLTDDALSSLDAKTAALFGFDTLTLIEDPSEKKRTFQCKLYPTDTFWPSEFIWSTLNWALGKNALIKTVPLASPCYNGWSYDAAKCASLVSNWTNSHIHAADPTSMMSPVYQGLTCEATLDPTKICTLGAFPYYAVNATNVAQIQLAVNFARISNIRLVVKNTGHDFSGKSGGAGSLSIWTHNLKDIKYFASYSATGTSYNGPAFKAGSGVQAFEIYKAAFEKGLIVLGGECLTVGIFGGYILGGGHSPLSSIYGMAADQVLSLEVVTADGRFVTADFVQNTDLFWALRGGGGSTFGIVTSLTVKAYPDLPVTASSFSFSVGGNGGAITAPNFWTAVRYYLDYFPSLSAQGIYAYWLIRPLADGPMFVMQPFWAPGKTLEETNALLAPWFAQLAALNITFTPRTVHYDSFYTGYLASFPLGPVSKTHVATGSRLMPKENWASPAAIDKTWQALKTSSEASLVIIAFIIDPSRAAIGYPNTAVNPAWRNTYSHMIQSVNWKDGDSAAVQLAARKSFTEGHMQRWRDISPGSGCYLGESDVLEPDFQQSMYGTAYPRLLSIKNRYDPRDVFFAQTAVGSEGWKVVTENGLPSGNGKLCRV